MFGASLAELVDEPETYGWPWDVAVITGAGYGDTAIDVVDERLAQPDVRDDIVDHGFYSFDPAVLFGDRPAPVVFGWSGRTAGDFPVREGRAPTRAGEALIGEDTAERLGLAVGDAVAVESTEFGALDLEVVGVGVLPSLGPFVADRDRAGHRRLHAGRRRAQRAQLARASPASGCATAPTRRRSSTGSGTTCRAGACSTRRRSPTTTRCGHPRS